MNLTIHCVPPFYSFFGDASNNIGDSETVFEVALLDYLMAFVLVALPDGEWGVQTAEFACSIGQAVGLSGDESPRFNSRQSQRCNLPYELRR